MLEPQEGDIWRWQNKNGAASVWKIVSVQETQVMGELLSSNYASTRPVGRLRDLTQFFKYDKRDYWTFLGDWFEHWIRETRETAGIKEDWYT